MALPRRPWTEPLSSPANAKAKLRRAFRSKTGAAPLRRGLGAWVTVPEECRDRCKLRKLSTQTAADSTGKRPAISWAKKERRTVNRAGRSPAVEALGRRAPQGGAFPSPGSLIRLASGRAGGGRGLGLGAFTARPAIDAKARMLRSESSCMRAWALADRRRRSTSTSAASPFSKLHDDQCLASRVIRVEARLASCQPP